VAKRLKRNRKSTINDASFQGGCDKKIETEPQVHDQRCKLPRRLGQKD